MNSRKVIQLKQIAGQDDCPDEKWTRRGSGFFLAFASRAWAEDVTQDGDRHSERHPKTFVAVDWRVESRTNSRSQIRRESPQPQRFDPGPLAHIFEGSCCSLCLFPSS